MTVQVSWAHPIDRFSAISLTGLQLFKVGYLMLPGLSWAEVLWLASGLMTGLYFKLADYHAVLEGDALHYCRSHTMWHVSLPLAFTAHTLWQLRISVC